MITSTRRVEKLQFPLGGVEGSRNQVIPTITIDLKGLIRSSINMPEQSTNINTIRQTIEKFDKLLGSLEIDDAVLAKNGIPAIRKEINDILKGKWPWTTEKLATTHPDVFLISQVFGSYFRQSTWASFTKTDNEDANGDSIEKPRQALLLLTKNICMRSPIEFSWAMAKLGPLSSSVNMPDLGEAIEILLVQRLVHTSWQLAMTGPSGIIVSDESAAFHAFSSRNGGRFYPYDNAMFRSQFMELIDGHRVDHSPILFVSGIVDQRQFEHMANYYLENAEHPRILRSRRIIGEATGHESVIAPHILTALLDSRVRSISAEHITMVAKPDKMCTMNGSLLQVPYDTDTVPYNDAVVHITKIQRPASLTASSIGTETGHGVPLLYYIGGITDKPRVIILPESQLLAMVETEGLELSKVTDNEGRFLSYYTGAKAETPTASDIETMITTILSGNASAFRRVKTAEDVANEIRANGHSLMRK